MTREDYWRAVVEARKEKDELEREHAAALADRDTELHEDIDRDERGAR